MYKRKVVFLLLISFLLTGCWDQVEIEDRAHISAVGIDKYVAPDGEERDDDKLEFTFAFPKNSLEDVEDVVISTVGDTLYSVSRIMADRTNKELFLGHLRVVVISTDITKNKNLFQGILDGIENNELLSRRVILTMTDENASDVINVKPIMEPRIGQFILELFRRKDRTPRIPEGASGEILKDLHESGNTLIPKITAGDTDVKVAGAGVISDYTFMGWLGELETEYLMILKGQVNEVGGLTIKHKGHIIPVNMKVQKSKMSLVESEDNIKIHIEVEAEGEIKQAYFQPTEDTLDAESVEKIQVLFSNEIEERMKDTIHKIQKEFRTDVIGINRFLRQRNYDVWKQVESDWKEIFPNIDIEVNMDIKIRRIGLVR